MNKKKGLLLFLALLLPILVFLFLRFFGKNQFVIPVYHLEPDSEIPTDCDMDYTFPYTVTRKSQLLDTGTTVLFFMGGLDSKRMHESNFELSRINSQMGGHGISLVKVQLKNGQTDPQEGVTYMDSTSYHMEKHCYFLADGFEMVLVDAEGRIRGYYKEASLKELDRLLVELKILLKEY